MKTIKPMKLGILTRCFEDGPKHRFVLSLFVMFPFDQPQRLLTEVELWKVVPEQLGPNPLFDQGMVKVNGELVVNGHAFAPRGKECEACTVSVKLGAIDKSLYVVGNRYWQGKHHTKPVPFLSVPVSYENAFGGDGFAENPIGKGYAPVDTSAGPAHPLPNIEDKHHPVASPKDRPHPAGLSAIDITWPQRASKLGTYDEKWFKTRYPGFAEDMDWTYFNTVPPDQRIEGFFEGTETFTIENMHPEKPLIEAALPGVTTRAFFTQQTADGEEFREIEMHLDTVHLFPTVERGVLIYRGTVQVAEDDAADILHLIAGCEALGQPKPRSHYAKVLALRLDKKRGAYHALRDSDLMPPSDDGRKETLIDAVDSSDFKRERLLRENLLRRAQNQLDAAREQMAANGVDVDKYVPETFPQEEATPSLDELPEYVEAKRKEAAERMALAEEKRKEALADTRAICEKQGLDFDQLQADAQKRAGGPPEFTAAKQLEVLQDQLQLAKNAGVSLPAVEAQLADPELLKKLSEVEVKLYQAYRKMAHHQPEASRLEPDAAARLRAEVSRAIVAGESLANRDLTGADLSELDLSGVDLEGAWLESANLAGTNFSAASLPGAVLARADLSGADLRSAKLCQANLGGAKLCQSLLESADLTGAILAGADLSGAKLPSATLTKADLTEATFCETDLSAVSASKVRFLKSNLTSVSLRKANLDQAVFMNATVSKTDFSDAQLNKAVFVETKGEQTVFQRVTATKLCFVKDCSFTEADFREADATLANFRGTCLNDSVFADSRLDQADFSGCELRSANFDHARARSANFTKADLDGADMTGIDLMCGLLTKTVLTRADFKGANLFQVDFGNARGDEATEFKKANLDFVRFHQGSSQ